MTGLLPMPDGRLLAQQPVLFPFMAPRLQGHWQADGRLDLAVWGAGEVARIRVTPPLGLTLYGPNSVEHAAGAFLVARSAPAILIKGAEVLGVSPARGRSPKDRPQKLRAQVYRSQGRWSADLPWASVVVEQRGGDLVIVAGADQREVRQGLALTAERIVAEAQAHAARCDLMPAPDSVIRSLVQQGAHTALSCVRADRSGAFAGIAAGLAYSRPARTYFRDGYWTCQMLLRLEPDAVRRQIDLLARGIRPDGEAPSGVIVEPRSGDKPDRHDWWSDHFDSPLFFILLLDDYALATGDADPMRAHWGHVRTIVARYGALCGARGLPEKPRHDRDWADNVFREGLVAYDLGLWVGVLEAVARLGREHDPDLAAWAAAEAEVARPRIEAALWSFRWFADYVTADGRREDHLALDSLMLLHFGAASEARAASVLDSVRVNLETRRNRRQPWGDWGMMCAFPPFAHRADLRAKTAFPFRYHNGADWPWLDGVYAAERLRRGLAGWRYPLVRWWEESLRQGWAGPVEYFSPPFARGGLLQGWSSLPAAVAVAFAEQVLAGDPEA